MECPSVVRWRRRCQRRPCQVKGVACWFQARAVCSNQVPISVGLCGCCPASARRLAALESALDRFGHVEPAAAERGVERHDAVLAQPDHHLSALVAGEVVPHEQQTQPRQRLGQGEVFCQSVLPAELARAAPDILIWAAGRPYGCQELPGCGAA